MSITMKELHTVGSPIIQIEAEERSNLTETQVRDMIGSAMSQALHDANDRANRMIKTVEERLKGLATPKALVLAVEVNGEQRKLSKPANPNLGRMIVNAKLGLNSLLVGPAGSGKTIAAEQLAEALGRGFGHVCLTAGASETWLFGRQTANGFIEGSFSEKYRNGGVFLGDELDAADANLMLAINTALANGHLYNPIIGENINRHPDFVFVGAANTLGRGGSSVYTGRSRLDAATLNRFVTLAVDYCPEIEAQVCPDDTLRGVLQNARKKLAELKSNEIISTRTLDQAFKQMKAGIDVDDIVASITMGWPDGMAKMCGLMGENPDRKSVV